MTKVTGGEAIVHSLAQHGIDTLFALPGVQNDHFFNALFDYNAKNSNRPIQVIHPRHEQGAAYMALGYAQSTGKVGAYCVVPGPGLLNTFGALCTAYSLNAKVLCLTGQIHSARIGRGFGELHEIPEQSAMLDTLTKWSGMIRSPADAPELVAEAFRHLHSGRPRPVGLEFPPDVLASKTEVDLRPIEHDIRWPLVDKDSAEEAAKILGQAEYPMIFVGSGAAEMGEQILALGEALQAPIVSNASGAGIVRSDHYLSMRSPGAYRYWEKTDAVLAIGSRIQRSLNGWGTDSNLKLIRVDIDPEEHLRGPRPDVSIVARSEDTVPALLNAVSKYNRQRPSIKADVMAIDEDVAERISYLEPQLSFIKAIRDALPEDGFFVGDVTQIGYVSRICMPFYQSRTFLDAGYQGTLGWGLATALGAKVANPDKQVVVACGDGGLMFNIQELATAVQHKINIVAIVFNDGAYGNVRRMQKEDHGNRFIATELQNPDFVQLAEAFGALGLRAHNADELRLAIQKGFEADVPTLIDVPVSEMPNPSKVAWIMPKIRGN
ncbi:MAG: thiamine pyrophosphate-dependent enzyme [Chloroflexota bacterium]